MTSTKIERCECCRKWFSSDKMTTVPNYYTEKSNRVCFGCIERAEEYCIILESEFSTKQLSTSSNFIKEKNMRILKPHEIKRELDKRVIGQEDAKRTISVALFNHQKRLELKKPNNKSNVLLIGPTGCGKTHILRNACEITDLPYVIVDATELTSSGYVGKDVSSMLHELVVKCKGSIKEAERGVIYIDEIDKIAKCKGPDQGRDISGESVQQGLLKMIEGGDITVEDRKGTKFRISTDNILFIFSGAFVGLEKVVSNRTVKKKSIGFNQDIEVKKLSAKQLQKKVTIDDIIDFGMIPELMGRIPIITVIDHLTKKQLLDILLNVEDSIIKEYKELFNLDNIKLTFTKEALNLVAKIAKDRGTGARGLNSIIEKVMIDIVYYVQESKNKVSKVNVELKNIKKVLDI